LSAAAVAWWFGHHVADEADVGVATTHRRYRAAVRQLRRLSRDRTSSRYLAAKRAVDSLRREFDLRESAAISRLASLCHELSDANTLQRLDEKSMSVTADASVTDFMRRWAHRTLTSTGRPGEST
jgi:hypothetical protein